MIIAVILFSFLCLLILLNKIAKMQRSSQAADANLHDAKCRQFWNLKYKANETRRT